MSAIATTSRAALTCLAPLFEWPDEAFDVHAARAAEEAACVDRRAADGIRSFAQELNDLGSARREITYTSTFDLAPSCSPYLGAHLFGDENRDRAGLMTGLKSMIAAAGRVDSGELPDHIAVVLSLAPHFNDEEWLDLLKLVLEPALARMEKALDGSHNPYGRLISTTRRLAQLAAKEGENS